MKSIERILPNRTFLIVCFLILLINPMKYVVLTIYHPSNTHFVAYEDDVFQLVLLDSAKWEYKDPWGEGWTVFNNPILGASYAYAILGFVPSIINIDALLTLLTLKVILGFVLLVVIWNVMNYFLEPKHAKIAFLLYLLVSGIGWLLYAVSLMTFGPHYTPLVGYTLTREFEELGGGANALSHLTRTYWILPEIFGLCALLALAQRKKVLAGILLGFSILFYPSIGIGLSLIIALYTFVNNWNGKVLSIFTSIRELLPVIIIATIFTLPWLIAYIQTPQVFKYYQAWFNSEAPITLVISFFWLMILTTYRVWRSKPSRHYWIILGGIGFFSTLLSLAYVIPIAKGNTLLQEWLATTGVGNVGFQMYNNLFLVAGPLLALIVITFLVILQKKINFNTKFVLLWIIVIIAITIVPTAWVPWWPARMRWLLLLPLSIFAAPALSNIAEKLKCIYCIKITPTRLTILLFVISIPSLAAFNIWQVNIAQKDTLSYLDNNDYIALRQLSEYPAGRVLALNSIGYNAPYVAHQRSILSTQVSDEQARDVSGFYLNYTNSQKRNVLEKYNISYVFFGKYEQDLTNTTDLDMDYLIEIYNSGTKIYKIVYQGL